MVKTAGMRPTARLLKRLSVKRIWRTTKNPWGRSDDKVCPICIQMSGKYEWHWIVEYPDGPPAHPNCRCTLDYKYQVKAIPAERRGAAKLEALLESFEVKPLKPKKQTERRGGAKLLQLFESLGKSRLASVAKSSACGAGEKGSPGFQEGNTCAEDGKLSGNDIRELAKLHKQAIADKDWDKIGQINDTIEKAVRSRFFNNRSLERLEPAQAQQYRDALDRVFTYMMHNAIADVIDNLGEVAFYHDMDSVTEAFYTKRGYPSEIINIKLADRKDRVTGFVTHVMSRDDAPADINLDGGRDITGSHDRDLLAYTKDTHEIYAHELGHVLDNRKKHSRSEAWTTAWQDEIKGQDDLINDRTNYRLSEYGATTPSEGFAEFARLVWTQPVEARELFPKCHAYWESQGWVPPSKKSGSESKSIKRKPQALKEIFVYIEGETDSGGILADFVKTDSVIKSACGAGSKGSPGFERGNTCAEGDGIDTERTSKIRDWAKKRFGSDEAADNFVKWFGDSKVVDEDGLPLVVYHATGAEFSEFSKRGYSQTGNKAAAKGHFFGADPESLADMYAPINDSGDFQSGAKTIPAFISIPSPKIYEVNSLSHFDKAYGEDSYSGDAIATYKGKPFAWVVVDPKQIKSATGNRGTFDPSDPNITKSARSLDFLKYPAK